MVRGFHRVPQHTSRYGRYSGGDPLEPPVPVQAALEAIGAEVMSGTSAERAMREYLRRGDRDREGLDDLARRVRERRSELLRRHRLDGTLEEIRKLLDHAVLEERKRLATDVAMDEDARAFAEMRMENLPPSTAAAVNDLADYEWQSPSARADYERIKELLGRELLDQRFAGMKNALENATDEDRQAVRDMLNDLNDLLEKRRLGEDTQEDFDEFMRRHGDQFPENPQNLDELLDTLAERSAAAQRMLNSMTPEQRAELMNLAAQAFGSPELMQGLSRLDDNLRSLRPGEDWTGSASFSGDEPTGLGEATGVMQDLSDLDSLSDQLSQFSPGARMDDIDLDALARLVGEDAAVSARALRDLEQELKDTGMLQRASDGALRLTPRAMRQLGRALLRDIATHQSGRAGQRETRQAGAAGDRTGATREWAFGDTEPWDIPRTVSNAVLRTVADGGDASAGVHLDTRDVEVVETEQRTTAAVALLVDTSFSMAMDGRWVPMKRTALALHHLISSRFRGDKLQLIAFSRYAEVMDIEQLTARDAVWDKGTNLHHALLLAQRHFRRNPAAQPVLLVVTDGEPTAHLESDGRVAFAYPPDPRTVAITVHELDNVQRLGTQTTFFRLGDDPGLARFMDALAQRAHGQVVAPELDELGRAVVDSYLGSRQPWRGSPEDFGDLLRGRSWWW
ncbi:vWA domain-containing protein [Microbacterium rhizosphaerae]|uniref:VWA domain-containing protein n=1 Tax=Microbacterium rhizosphaerae TaxID=1678237 RepID=A0ABZ0SM22_9MICO|nr:VWA domain-containing protein [Microbacterium rhizosphaerae]WPR89316.1 VWA domain-containing protein [Microbacterium rhizosphaerae]